MTGDRSRRLICGRGQRAIVGRIYPTAARRGLDLGGLLTCATVLVLCCILAYFSAGGTLVYWFGNWRPSPDVHSPAHFPVGICFVIEPLGAGLAALVGLLSTAAFAFSWAYFEQVKSLYHALMLAFVGAMCGLCLTSWPIPPCGPPTQVTREIKLASCDCKTPKLTPPHVHADMRNRNWATTLKRTGNDSIFAMW